MLICKLNAIFAVLYCNTLAVYEELVMVLLLLIVVSIVVAEDRLCSLVVRIWLLTQKSRVRFPALSDFLRSSGSGTGPSSPCEDK
jgi:hypothetical protein